MSKPRQVTIRAYQVGFGDCFLLSFGYENDGDRHILIDFGSTAPPEWSGNVKDFKMSQHMMAVAESIAEESGGKLHAVVATHRHKDHISGFATRKDGKGSGDVIRALEPDVVIQPWTEDPDAAPDATAPTQISKAGKAFVGALGNMHSVSQALLTEVRRMYPGLDGGDAGAAPAAERAISKRLASRLAFMGENNIANKSAVENLMTMAKKKSLYVHSGSESKLKDVLEELLPGVGVRILGPPTLEQTETIEKQRQRDESEFWHLQARANRFAVGRRANSSGLFPGTSSSGMDDQPRANRWLIERMKRLRGQQLLEIVRILDKAMNNTSVILLFDCGKHKLLFPGDAQIENWSYTLKGPEQKANRKLLKQVTFYKVGHHGSLNATPKTLWNGFALRSPDEDDASRLRTIVSTRKGKHGNSRRNTEVPRKTLVEALSRESSFFTTESLKSKQLFELLELPL